jgi:hypothetical protein
MVVTLSDSLRLMDTAALLAANFKGLTDAVRSNVSLGMDNIKVIAGELSKLLSGGASGSGITANITYQGGLPPLPASDISGSYLKGSHASSAPASRGGDQIVNLTIQVKVEGSLIHDGKIEDAIVKGLEEAQRKGRLLNFFDKGLEPSRIRLRLASVSG